MLANRFIMNFKSENKYTVFFKDSTSFSSNGSCEGIKKSSVLEEFKWVAFHIEKEVLMKNKTLEDILKVEYNLSFTDSPEVV